MCRCLFLVAIIVVLIHDIVANSWWHFLTYICSAKVLQMNTLFLNTFHRQARQFEAHVCYKVQLTSRSLLQSSGISGHSRAIVLIIVPIRGLSQKSPAIFNISRTGHVALMKLGSQSEETFLRIHEKSLSRVASQSLVGHCWLSLCLCDSGTLLT
jgi:hypothetical protein